MENYMVETKPSNRRRAPRRKPRGYVKLECRKGAIGLGSNVATILMDVSETGARLVVNQELVLQKEVEVLLASQGLRQPIKRLANIRWQLKLDDGKFCIGVEFQKRLTFAELQNLASPG